MIQFGRISNKFLKGGVLIAAVSVLTACGGGGGETTDNAAAAGEELFGQTVIGSQAGCITCHSLDEGVVVVGVGRRQERVDVAVPRAEVEVLPASPYHPTFRPGFKRLEFAVEPCLAPLVDQAGNTVHD